MMSSKLSVRVKSTILAQTLFWDCQNCWHFVEKNWLSVCNRLNPIWCLHRLKQTTDMTYKTICAPGSVNHFFFFTLTSWWLMTFQLMTAEKWAERTLCSRAGKHLDVKCLIYSCRWHVPHMSLCVWAEWKVHCVCGLSQTWATSVCANTFIA